MHNVVSRLKNVQPTQHLFSIEVKTTFDIVHLQQGKEINVKQVFEKYTCGVYFRLEMVLVFSIRYILEKCTVYNLYWFHSFSVCINNVISTTYKYMIPNLCM